MGRKPSNPTLYELVKRDAKRRFERWPSAYGSAWLVKEYARRGGTWSSSSSSSSRNPRRSGGIDRWMREKWVQVGPALKGRHIACGQRKGRSKACRPSRRVSSRTPLTVDEVVARHGRKRVAELARSKRRNMSARVDWKRGKVVG